MYICVFMCVHLWGPVGTVYLLFGDRVSYIGLELSEQVRLAGQGAPGVLLHPPPQHWGYKHIPSHWLTPRYTGPGD